MYEVLEYAYNVQHPALFLDMRLRKSLLTLRMCKYYNSKLILIVCPLSAILGWSYWLNKELHLETKILIGTKKQRKKIFDTLNMNGKTYQIFIINHAGYQALPAIKDIKWDAVIFDESRSLNNPKSKLAKFYIKNFREVDHRFILSGLPAPESELEYYNQLEFLNPSILNYASYYQFKFYNFGEIYPNKFRMFTNKKKEFTGILSKYCFFLSRKDVNLGGKLIYKPRYLISSKKFKEVYKKLVKNFILEYEELEKKTKFAPVKFAWLRKLCGGFVDDTLIFKEKISATTDLIKNEFSNEQIIIWAYYVDEINALQKAIKNSRVIHGQIKVKDRDKIKKDFRFGKFKVLIVEVETERYGSDFSFCTTMLYYSLPLGLNTFEQGSARCVNIDKQDDILIIPLLMDKCIDTRIYKNLQKKNSNRKITEDLVKFLYKENKKLCQ